MAITETSICNSALLKLGADRITSLSEGSKQAKLCNEQYAKMRDEVLTQHPWNFALKRAAIAADVSAPEWGYAYKYSLPADCLRVHRMESPDMEYKVEGRYVLTDEGAPLNILYIAQITDTAQFTPLFAEAVSCRLAADISYAVNQSSTVQKTMLDMYQYQLKLARSMDAQEGTPEDLDASSWVTVRF